MPPANCSTAPPVSNGQPPSPPVSPAPNAAIQYFKFDGSEHWRIEAELLGEDEWGWWLRGHPGYRVSKAGEVAAVEAVGFLFLVPRSAWWAAMWNFDRAGDYELYIDVAMPASRAGAEFRLVDLDLDVVRDWNGQISLLDEDEFIEHAVRYNYPDHVRYAARRSADSLLSQVRSGTSPFDLCDAAANWPGVQNVQHGR